MNVPSVSRKSQMGLYLRNSIQLLIRGEIEVFIQPYRALMKRR